MHMEWTKIAIHEIVHVFGSHNVHIILSKIARATEKRKLI